MRLFRIFQLGKGHMAGSKYRLWTFCFWQMSPWCWEQSSIWEDICPSPISSPVEHRKKDNAWPGVATLWAVYWVGQKVCSGFPIRWYRKTWTNIYCSVSHNPHHLIITYTQAVHSHYPSLSWQFLPILEKKISSQCIQPRNTSSFSSLVIMLIYWDGISLISPLVLFLSYGSQVELSLCITFLNFK